MKKDEKIWVFVIIIMIKGREVKIINAFRGEEIVR